MQTIAQETEAHKYFHSVALRSLCNLSFCVHIQIMFNHAYRDYHDWVRADAHKRYIPN